MERIKVALIAIKRDHSVAEEVIERGLAEDRQAFIGGLAAFVSAALDGYVANPDKL